MAEIIVDGQSVVVGNIAHKTFLKGGANGSKNMRSQSTCEMHQSADSL